MFKRSMLSMAAFFALSGCLGGGGGSSSAVATVSVVSTFADGAGVSTGVANSEDGNLPVIIMAPEIVAVTNALNSDTDDDSDELDFDSLPIVQVLASGANCRQGTVTFDGQTVNAIAIDDRGDEAFLFGFESNGVAAAIAIGTPLTGTPVGTQTYTGTLTMGVRGALALQELGSFTMGANFSTNTFTFNGTTTSNSLNGSGVIDTGNGTFASNNLTAVTNGTNRTATMFGNLHGNAATSVSGLFHTNEATPTHAGGFVGSR